MIRLYSLPPTGVHWDYLLVNPKNYRELYRRTFEHAILDCGVSFFQKNPDAKDYPEWFKREYVRLAKELSLLFGDKIWVVIPDYPDDYHPGQFGDNVEKTIKNIEEFVSIDGVNWVPVVQSRYMNRKSFLYSCLQLRNLLGEYPRIAIGSICKVRSPFFAEYCCKTARAFFPDSWIHAFGLSLRALPLVHDQINSFDSLAYTFPRTPGRSSARNKNERMKNFSEYVSRVQEIVSRNSSGADKL